MRRPWLCWNSYLKQLHTGMGLGVDLKVGTEGRRKLALIVEYDGTRYHGFQYQANASSIQAELESALYRLTGERTRVKGASRTDAGAHAGGQVVAFPTECRLPTNTFVEGLNYYLPEDIAVQAAFEAPLRFDPRREALSRVYRYTILNRLTPSPLLMRFSYREGRSLKEEVMSKAAELLVGENDFGAFTAGVPKGKSTVRRVLRAEVRRCGDLVLLEIEGNAFLPQQIRRIAGALVQVGLRRLSVNEFAGLVREARPGAAGWPLPARGLCLVRVQYDSALVERENE